MRPEGVNTAGETKRGSVREGEQVCVRERANECESEREQGNSQNWCKAGFNRLFPDLYGTLIKQPPGRWACFPGSLTRSLGSRGACLVLGGRGGME